MTSMRCAGGSWSRAGWLCPLLLALVLPACGGGGGSGVDGDKELGELSQEEVVEFCEWSLDLVSRDDTIRFGCYLAALALSGGDAEQCQEIADQCIEEEAAEPDEPSEEVCAEAEGFPPCAAELTVDQLESCSEDSADQLHDVAEDISCDGAVEDFEDIESPGSCDVIEEACPDLFDDDPEATARRLASLAAARRAGSL